MAAESFAGEFDNITVHIGGTGAYEDFNGNSVNDANELQSWPHMFPTVNHQDAGELWYRDRLLAGTIPQPVLNDSDELQVAGFVKTAKFDCWLGDGQNAAGTLSYSLSDTLMSFSLALLTSDLRMTGDLSIDTARMAGREVRVELNDEPVSTFSGGGTFEFSGLGHNDTLELIDTGGENTFSNWIAGFDVGGLDGLDEDPDGDGIQNGVENVFGTLPDTFSQGLVAGAVTGNTFTFTHPLNATPAGDLTATYRWSTDLQAFHDDGDSNGGGTTTVTFSEPTTAGEVVSVTATITGSVIPDKLFVVVEVTQN